MSSQPFQIDEEDRFDRFRLIPWWDQGRLARSTVLVVGAGAIGNEAIKNLALLGVGKIVIVDRDLVEISNLSRSILFRDSDRGRPKAEVAAEVVQSINPNCQAIAIVGDVLFDLGLSWFNQSDIVLGCLDNREARLWVNRCCWRVGRPWIDAGIQEIQGAIQVFEASKAPCYECGMKEVDYRLIQARYSCPGIQKEDSQVGRVPTTPTIASMIAGWQTQIAVKAIHGLLVPWGHSMVMNGFSDQTYRTQLQEKPDCLSHEVWELEAESGGVTSGSTIESLLQYSAERWSGEWKLLLERRVATKLTCDRCSVANELSVPIARFRGREGRCVVCEDWMNPTWLDNIEIGSAYAKLTFNQLGIPDGDWVRIQQGKCVKVVGLAIRENEHSSR